VHVLLYLDILLLLIVFITDHGMSPYVHITFGNVVTYYYLIKAEKPVDPKLHITDYKHITIFGHFSIF